MITKSNSRHNDLLCQRDTTFDCVITVIPYESIGRRRKKWDNKCIIKDKHELIPLINVIFLHYSCFLHIIENVILIFGVSVNILSHLLSLWFSWDTPVSFRH